MTWGCDADSSSINAVQKGREESPKTGQGYGQAEGVAKPIGSPGRAACGVSGSSVAGELEGVSGCSHRARLVAAIPSGR